MGGENQDQIRQPSGVLKWIRFRTPKNKGHAQKKTAARGGREVLPRQPGDENKRSPGSPGRTGSAPQAAWGRGQALPGQPGEDKKCSVVCIRCHTARLPASPYDT